MRLSPALAVALSTLLFATAVGVGGGVGTHAPQAEPPDGSLEPADPKQVIELTIDASGDVEWRIAHRFLVPADRLEAFDQFAASVVAGDRPVEYDEELFRDRLTDAEAATGREMALSDGGWEEPRTVAVEGEDQYLGVIAYSITWEDFARADESRIVFGDAFDTAAGTWFPSLADGQELVIQPPENYAFEDAPPTETRNGSLVWQGPHVFEGEELDMVLVRTGQVFGLPPLVLAGLGAVIAVAAIGGYVLLRHSPSLPTRDGVGTQPDEADGGGAAPGEPEGDVVEFDERREIDTELLSDEERVHRMLVENGGRMKQASIVKETQWSNAKVSQLLSKMDDDGEIEKLRIGRENLITLPEVDPTEIE